MGLLLASVEAGLDRPGGQGCGGHMGGVEEIAVGDRIGPTPLGAPPDGALGDVLRRSCPAGCGLQNFDLTLLWACGREGKPGLHGHSGGIDLGLDRGAYLDPGGEAPLGTHTGEHSVPPGMVRRTLKQSGCLQRIDAQGLQKLVVAVELPVDIAPVNTAGIYQRFKGLLGKVGPLGPYHRNRLVLGVGIVGAQPFQPDPLSQQSGRQFRLVSRGQTGVDQAKRAGQVACRFSPGNITGQSVVQVCEDLVFTHEKNPPPIEAHSVYCLY